MAFNPKYIDKIKTKTGKFRYIYELPTGRKKANAKKTSQNGKKNKVTKKLKNAVAKVKKQVAKKKAKESIEKKVKTKDAKVLKKVNAAIEKTKKQTQKQKNKETVNALTAATAKAKEKATVAKAEQLQLNKAVVDKLSSLTDKAKQKALDIQQKRAESMSEEHYKTQYPKGVKKQKTVKSTKDLKKKTEKCSKAEDMALTNPFYQKSLQEGNVDFRYNCASCSLAYELRRRGYDVEAGAYNNKDVSTRDLISAFGYSEKDVTNSIYSNAGIHQVSISKHQKEQTIKEIESQMINGYKEGSRGHLGVCFSDGSAHSTMWEVENNKLVIRDTQRNKIYNLSEFADIATDLIYFRTDDREISSEMLDKFNILNRR